MSQPTDYLDFLARKARRDPCTGLDDLALPDLPEALFQHQRDIVAWALKRGRAAVFAQTGLGKSFMELAWGQAVHKASYFRQAVLNLQRQQDELAAALV